MQVYTVFKRRSTLINLVRSRDTVQPCDWCLVVMAVFVAKTFEGWPTVAKAFLKCNFNPPLADFVTKQRRHWNRYFLVKRRPPIQSTQRLMWLDDSGLLT
ncbi:hypothetical protein J6590_047951 [Homalodisca vitripennis]|nr:hypothetical protein J6590_047951 [Homalodisca vitripennis]